MVLIAPSILSADFANLEAEVRAVEQAGADWIHVDVMDGQFVPNITMGPVVVRAIRKITKLPLDVHLMIVEPERYIQAFADAGADRLTIHPEATKQLKQTLTHIRNLGKKAGVAINPQTSEQVLGEVLAELDTVLVMTVNPGFSGQNYMEKAAQKIPAVRQMLKKAGNRQCLIEVDGGINEDTAKEVVSLGADVLVAGNAIFATEKNYREAMLSLRGISTI